MNRRELRFMSSVGSKSGVRPGENQVRVNPRTWDTGLILDAIRDGVHCLDPEGRIVLQNPPAVKMLGWEETELQGKLLQQAGYVSRPAGGWEASPILSTLRDGIARRVDHEEFLRRDGSMFPVEYTSTPVRDSSGATIGTVMVFSDVTERRRAADELRESEEKFRQLADNIKDLFWTAAPDLTAIHYVSPGWEQIMGSSVESLIELPERWLEAIHRDDRGAVMQFFGGLTADKAEVSAEYRIVRPDGEIRWVLGRGFQVRDASGQLVRLTGIVTDITERKQAERSLRSSEERLRYLMTSNPAVTLTLRFVEGGTELSWISDNHRQFFDADPDAETDDVWWADHLHPDDREQVLSDMRRPHPEDRWITKYRFRKRDGTYFWIRDEKVVMRDAEGQPSEILVSLVDITDLKRNEEELQESEERFRGTFEQVAVGMAHVSPEGRFLRVNQKLADILGYSPEALLGMSFMEVTVPEDQPASYVARQALLAGEKSSHTTEKRYIRSDGEAVWINLATTLVRTSAHEPKYFISVFQDITPRKLAEFRLHRLNRLHAVLSKTSGAIGRMRDRQELYETVCRIVVDDGKLPMSFIAELDPASGRVRPAFSYGENTGCLDGVEITADGGPQSLGTVGMAIRTGRPDVCNDVARHPRHALAREQRFLASASFPIRLDQTTVGALVLLAAEVDYFHEDEIRLMVAVADQISIALEMQRREEKRQQAESALRASEQQFFSAFEYAAIGLALVGLKGNFLKVNRALCQMLGYPDETLLNFTFQDLTHPDDLNADLENVRQLMRGEIHSYQMEKRYFHQRGHLVWALLSVSMVSDEKGLPLHFIAQVQDITLSRQTHEAVRMQAHMLGHIGQAAIATDIEGRVIYANRFAGELYGWQPAEMLGRDIMEVTIPRIGRRQAEEIMALLQRGESWSGEIDVQRRDGTVFAALNTTSPLLDEQGKLIGFIGISSDISARKRAEETLRQKDSLIRIAGRATRTGGWSVELSDQSVTWSDEIFEMLEYPRGTAPSVSAGLAMYPEPWREKISEAVAACSKDGTSFDLEVEILTGRGRRIWVRVCGDADRHADGSILRVQGAFQDISERRQAVKELRRSDQRYRSLVEATTAIVWDTPESGRFETPQPAWSAFTGQTFEELQGSGWLDAVHPDDRAETARVWSAAVADRSIYEVEHRLRSRDGTYHDMMVRAVPILGDDGTIEQFIGIHTDITERKRAAENLAANEVLLRQFIQHTPAAIAMLDRNMCYVQTSERWIQDYQLGDQEIIGKSHYEIFPDSPPHWLEIHQRAMTGHVERCEEDPFPRADGSIDWLQWEVRPWREASGGIGGLIFFTQVITARKRAEAEAERLNAKLIDASRRAGMAEVATSVLHNVGNVLNSVNVSATIASEKIRNSGSSDLMRIAALFEQHREDLPGYMASVQGRKLPSFLTAVADHLTKEQQGALSELQLLDSHIDHIKDIVAMQQSHARLAVIVEEMAPVSLAVKALGFNASALERHGIEVVEEYEETPMVRVDKHKALQIIINLIANAKNAMTEPGAFGKRLTLGIQCGEANTVEISVRDQGTGIPAANLPRIFEHGFTTRAEGHGFGLHSAALAAQDLGGSLIALSEGPGQGAMFILALPGYPSSSHP